MKAIAFSLLLLATSAPAFATGPTGEVGFASGVTVPEKVVVNEKLWRCADGSCSGPGEARGVAMMRACKTLARDIGTVARFKVGVAALEEAAIRQCNSAAE